MGFGSALRISASALTAERLRMDVIANNVANAHTTGAEGPYQRQRVVFRSAGNDGGFASVLRRQAQPPGLASSAVVGTGVRVVRVEQEESPGQRVFEPGHPDADAEGYVTYPDVNVTSEMVDLLSATKAYQANVTVINAVKNMANKALSIGTR